jgi:hypothetical protein
MDENPHNMKSIRPANERVRLTWFFSICIYLLHLLALPFVFDMLGLTGPMAPYWFLGWSFLFFGITTIVARLVRMRRTA